MQKEISPAMMWGTLVVVAAFMLFLGFRYFTRNPGQLTQDEEQKAKATIQQQYQGYYGGIQDGRR